MRSICRLVSSCFASASLICIVLALAGASTSFADEPLTSTWCPTPSCYCDDGFYFDPCYADDDEVICQCQCDYDGIVCFGPDDPE